MSSPENTTQDPISSFIGFRPDIYDFFKGRRLVFQVLKTMGLLNLTCPRGHETVFREDHVDNPKIGYCSLCKQYFSVLTNTFFARKKIRSIDEFSCFVFLLLTCSPNRELEGCELERRDYVKVREGHKWNLFYEGCEDEEWRLDDQRTRQECRNDEVHLAERKYTGSLEPGMSENTSQDLN